MSTLQQSVAVLMLVCTAPVAGLAAYAYSNLDEPGARGFLLCTLGAIGWSLQLAALTWPAHIMPVYLNTTARMAFQFMVIFGWPLLVWEHVKRRRVDPRRSFVAALLVVPVLTLALAVTNPRHHLVLAAESPPNPAGISEFVLGPWYLVFLLFAVVMTMTPAGYVLYELRGAHGPHRKQLALLLAGFLVGFPGALQTYVLRNIDAVPLFVDLTPLSFAVAAVLWGLALFRYNLFGMIPVSRRIAVETIEDPLISVDGDGRVVDANPAAQTLFGVEGTVVGTHLETFCRAHQTVFEKYEEGVENAELTLETEVGTRHFVLSVQPITDGKTHGSVLLMREVTRLRERERELDLLKQVFSRVFRHNMRNDLMILRSHATAIEVGDEGDQFVDHTDSIFEKTDEMLGHSEKAKNLQGIIDTEQTDAVVDLGRVVTEQVTTFRETHPDVTFAVDAPDDIVARCHPEIGTAVTEALENAIAHFDRDRSELEIGVTLEQTDETVVLTVTDNGPGIDDTERATLAAGEETALQHSAGVGLWMMTFIVRKSGGRFDIEDVSPRGTRLRMRLPADT